MTEDDFNAIVVLGYKEQAEALGFRVGVDVVEAS